MNKLNSLAVCCILLIAGCKSTSKLTIFYGTRENLLIYSNEQLINGDLTFTIGEYNFIMKYSDLKESVSDINKEHFYSPLDLKLPDKVLTNLQGFKDYLIVNKTDTLKYPNSYIYDPFLDHLLRQGKMYFEKSGKPLLYIEYIHWDPQYQGPVYSRWIDNGKIIKERTWAIAD